MLHCFISERKVTDEAGVALTFHNCNRDMTNTMGAPSTPTLSDLRLFLGMSRKMLGQYLDLDKTPYLKIVPIDW